MTNTRVHPIKRVIIFILALLMVLSSVVYFGIDSNSAIADVTVYNNNNWNGYYNTFFYNTGLYLDILDYNIAYNPFSVSSEGYFSSAVTLHETGMENAVVATSQGSTIPVGYKMGININTSGGGVYYAVDGNNIAASFDEALALNGINYGCFSIGALTSPVPDETILNNHINYRPITHGLASCGGLVVNFHHTDATFLEYTYAYVYYDGVLRHMIKLSDRGITVKCNGNSGIIMELRRTGTDDYDIYITGSGQSAAAYLCSLEDLIDDDTQYYYAAGSFPSGMGALSVGADGGIVHGGAKTDGSFTITSVSSCAGNSAPNAFSGTHGHNFVWNDNNSYKLYKCTNTGCNLISKKSIKVTYDANGGEFSGGNTLDHEANANAAGADVTFTPSSTIRPTKPGYDLLGWSTDPDATEPMATITSKTNLKVYAVYSKSTYTLTLDPLGGTFEDGTTANKTYSIQNSDLYQTVVGDMPNPTKRGYKFDGWAVNGGLYAAPDWAPTASYQAFESLTFTAQWSSIDGYTLTFDTNGGTMPSNYQTEYLFYPNEKFQDIIGGFPVPTKARHRFIGWQNSAYAADMWETGWGTQPYTFGQDVTLVAQWEEVPGYTLTLDAGKGTFTDTGDHTAQYILPPGEKFVDHNVPFAIPVRTGYVFLGWQWNNRTDHFWTDGWGTQPYTFTDENGNYIDVTFNAVWQVDHTHDVTLKETVTFPIGGDQYRSYDKVVCGICGDELYGFKCLFYSRNTGIVDFNYGGGSKYLNRDVLLTDVFVNPMVSACNTYILSETASATVQLQFDPFIRGANDSSKALFLGWTSGAPSAYNRGLGYTEKNGMLTMICHDNYFAYYQADCYEYLFDATNAEQYTNIGGDIEVSFAKLVQENRNYGIAVVPLNGYYDSYIDYVPSMKCVDQDQLRATNTWYYQGFGLNLVNLHNFNGERVDKILYPGTSNRGWGATQGAPKGRMNTYYANNKGAKYVEAHYDPNYRYSGTMYYRYEKNFNGEIIMYPDFTFDPRRDPADDNPLYDANLGMHPDYFVRDHEDYHKEFDWNAYFEANPDKTSVIIKDPRMYTTYIGDEDPYKFIRIVAEPHGDVYNSMGKNDDGTYNINDTDPDIRAHEVYVEALHDNVYEGDSYIVYKKTNGVHTLPDYRLARDYTKQYNEFSSRYPLYYVYKSDHQFSDYGVTDYDNRYPTKFDRGNLTDRGFEPISGTYEPLWAYGDGGWNCFDILENEKDGYREEWGGFSQILQYPDPESTLIVNNPNFTESQRMIYQYSAYQQWDNKVQFNANVPASYLTNADNYGGFNEAYLYTVSYGQFYMPDANLFTRDRYVITGWATSAERAEQGIIDFDCGEKINPDELCCYTLKDGTEFVFTSFTVNADGSTTAPTLYAVWKHIVNFTLEEGEDNFGGNPFAVVTYKSAMTGRSVTENFNATKTIKTVSYSDIEINIRPAATGYVYSYLTLNQINLPYNADRILTNKINYKFTIFDDTAMTAQFTPVGSTTGFYIDRNNKLLRSASDTWRLYTATSASTVRMPLGVTDDGENNALYFAYKYSTSSNYLYDITVNGSTYSSQNSSYADVPYDDLLTVMTAPVDSSGNDFVGWKFLATADTNADKTAEFVSYDLVYKHRVSCDGVLTAVYSGTAEPTIYIVHERTENSRDVLVSQRVAPDGYTLLETGFFITKSKNYELDLDCIYDDNGLLKSDIYKIVSTDSSRDGIFKVLFSSSTYYGIAYAYYLDPNGKIVSCVSPKVTQ